MFCHEVFLWQAMYEIHHVCIFRYCAVKILRNTPGDRAPIGRGDDQRGAQRHLWSCPAHALGRGVHRGPAQGPPHQDGGQ